MKNTYPFSPSPPHPHKEKPTMGEGWSVGYWITASETKGLRPWSINELQAPGTWGWQAVCVLCNIERRCRNQMSPSCREKSRRGSECGGSLQRAWWLASPRGSHPEQVWPDLWSPHTALLCVPCLSKKLCLYWTPRAAKTCCLHEAHFPGRLLLPSSLTSPRPNILVRELTPGPLWHEWSQTAARIPSGRKEGLHTRPFPFIRADVAYDISCSKC